MSGHSCVHCTADSQAAAETVHTHEPVALPDRPRSFRVHGASGSTQDCTLHPDGTLATVIAGQHLRSALTLDEMLAMNWATARIEWDPEPPPPSSVPATPAVEEPLSQPDLFAAHA